MSPQAAPDPWKDFNLQPMPQAAPAGGNAPAAAPSDQGAAPAGYSDFNLQPMPSTAEDVGKAGTGGLVKGGAQLVASPLSTPGILSGLDPYVESLIGKLPFQPSEAQKKAAAASWESQSTLTNAAKASAIGGQAVTEAITKPIEAVTKGGYFDPSYVPQTAAGGFAGTVGEYAPNLLLGRGAILPRLATDVVAPAAGAEVGGALGEATGHPELGRAAGAVLGGGAAHAAGAVATQGPRSALEAVRPPVSQDVLDQAATLGMQPPPRFVATDSPLTSTVTGVLGKAPIVRAPLASAGQAYLGDLESAANRLGTTYGAASPSVMGQGIEDAFNRAQADVSAKAKAGYDAVTTTFPPGGDQALGPLNQTQQAAQDIVARRAAAGNDPGPAVNMAMNGLTMPGGMTYQGMRDFRSDIREAGDKAGLTPRERAEFDTLENSVTQDIRTHLDTIAPNSGASTLWDQANQIYRSDQGRISAVYRKLGLDPNTPREDFVNTIAKMASTGSGADIAGLRQIMDTLPTNVREQTAASIARGWWTDPQTGAFSPQNFFANYSAMDPTARDVLFGTATPGQASMRQSYDALSAMTRRAPIAQAVVPRPGIGGATATGAGGAAELGAAWLMGLPKVAALVGGGAGLSALLSRPATASSFARLARAQQGYQLANRLNRGTQTAARVLWGEAGNFANTANQAGAHLDADQLAQALLSLPTSLTAQ